MDSVMNKLSDIETKAKTILDEANARKKEISKDFDMKTAAFDQELEASTAKKVADLKSRMEVEMLNKLTEQKSEAQKALEQMETNYKNHHEDYTRQLLQSMIEG